MSIVYPAVAAETHPVTETTVVAPPTVETTFSAPNWAFGNAWSELGLLGMTVLSLGGSELVHQHRSNWGPDTVHPSERIADNNSFATVGGALGLSAGYYLWVASRFNDAGTRSNRAYWLALPTLLADVEATLLATSVTNVLKKRLGRCRPRTYRNATCDPSSDDNFEAFPSGHTTIPSALAGVHLVQLFRAPSLTNTLFFTGIELSALTTGGLRVLAGAHSLSDVGAGWLIGHLTGLGIGLIHPQQPYPRTRHGLSVVPTRLDFDGRNLTFTASF